MTDIHDTPEVALARQIHKRQALDRGHGPFTTRCICNLHAAEILTALDGLTLVPSDDLLMVKAQEAAYEAEIAQLRASLDAHHLGLTTAGDGPEKCAVCRPAPALSAPGVSWGRDPHDIDDQYPCLVCSRVTSHDHSTAEWNAALAAAHVSLT